MHKVQLLSEPTSGLNTIYSISCPYSFPLITCFYFLVGILSRIQASFPRHRYGSVTPLPVPSCFLAVPKVELEARHPPRMANCVVTETIRSRRSFATSFLAVDPPSLPPTTLAASWSMKLLPSTPRRPKLSTAKAASLWLRSSNVPDERSVDACMPRR